MDNWAYQISYDDLEPRIDARGEGFESYIEAKHACNDKMKELINEFNLEPSEIQNFSYLVFNTDEDEAEVYEDALSEMFPNSSKEEIEEELMDWADRF